MEQKTILITGSSSGYGLETARHFLAKGWNVIATMREPMSDVLPPSDRLRILQLDVTDPASIAAAIEAAGPIDVLVNNAGIGLIGVLEATPMAKAREIFDTNTFGVMAMTQAVIPQFRERGDGVIVNVTSSVTLAPMPLVSIYAASKKAIQGFSESLAYEMNHFGVRVKVVEPGYAPTTAFTRNLSVRIEHVIPASYMPFAQPILDSFGEPAMTTKPTDVAEAVWEAVHDTGSQLFFPAGPDAVALAANR